MVCRVDIRSSRTRRCERAAFVATTWSLPRPGPVRAGRGASRSEPQLGAQVLRNGAQVTGMGAQVRRNRCPGVRNWWPGVTGIGAQVGPEYASRIAVASLHCAVHDRLLARRSMRTVVRLPAGRFAREASAFATWATSGRKEAHPNKAISPQALNVVRYTPSDVTRWLHCGMSCLGHRSSTRLHGGGGRWLHKGGERHEWQGDATFLTIRFESSTFIPIRSRNHTGGIPGASIRHLAASSFSEHAATNGR